MQCGGYATNIKASGCDPSAHTSPTLTQNVVVVLCVRMQWRRVPLNSCPAIFFCQTASRCFTSFDALPRLRRPTISAGITDSHSLSFSIPTYCFERESPLIGLRVRVLEYLSLGPDESVRLVDLFFFILF